MARYVARAKHAPPCQPTEQAWARMSALRNRNWTSNPASHSTTRSQSSRDADSTAERRQTGFASSSTAAVTALRDLTLAADLSAGTGGRLRTRASRSCSGTCRRQLPIDARLNALARLRSRLHAALGQDLLHDVILPAQTPSRWTQRTSLVVPKTESSTDFGARSSRPCAPCPVWKTSNESTTSTSGML